MPRKLIATLSLCSLILAGCQSTGGLHKAPPPDTQGQQPPPPTTSEPARPESSDVPWEQARSRNMAFRAVGNEPGWNVEVEKSRQPTLFLNLDYGQRHLKVPQASVSVDEQSGTITFRGQADDTSPVELVIHRGQCQDDMSGQQLDASAKLEVGSQTYKGCGKFLFQ